MSVFVLYSHLPKGQVVVVRIPLVLQSQYGADRFQSVYVPVLGGVGAPVYTTQEISSSASATGGSRARCSFIYSAGNFTTHIPNTHSRDRSALQFDIIVFF